jgi:hypothetical protein
MLRLTVPAYVDGEVVISRLNSGEDEGSIIMQSIWSGEQKDLEKLGARDQTGFWVDERAVQLSIKVRHYSHFNSVGSHGHVRDLADHSACSNGPNGISSYPHHTSCKALHCSTSTQQLTCPHCRSKREHHLLRPIPYNLPLPPIPSPPQEQDGIFQANTTSPQMELSHS